VDSSFPGTATKITAGRGEGPRPDQETKMFHSQAGHLGRRLAVPLAAAGLAVLAACGSSDEAAPAADPAAPASATPSAAPEDGGAFADCMTQQGVPAPQGGTRITGEPRQPDAQQGGPVTRRNPPPAPEGVDPQAWEAALEACSHLAPRRTVAPAP
jgi:hypothetical protein